VKKRARITEGDARRRQRRKIIRRLNSRMMTMSWRRGRRRIRNKRRGMGKGKEEGRVMREKEDEKKRNTSSTFLYCREKLHCPKYRLSL
jgi:hypothetical protein